MKRIETNITKEQLEYAYLVEMKSQGDIATEFHTTINVILRLLKEFNIPKHSRSESRSMAKKTCLEKGIFLTLPISDSELTHMYMDDNLSVIAIADKLGVDRSLIDRNIHRLKLSKTEENNRIAIENYMIDKYGVKNGLQMKSAREASESARRQWIDEHPGVFEKWNKGYDVEKFSQMYSNNVSMKEIKEEFGFSEKEVYYRAYKLNIHRDISLISQHKFEERIGSDAYRILSNKDFFVEFLTSLDNKTTACISETLGISPNTARRAIVSYGLEEMIQTEESGFEHEVKVFIESLGIKTEKTKRIIYPKELDVYCPDYNIAIECNGTYWHSDLVEPDRKYHLNKSLMCNDKNIRLIHIFEHEWNDKRIRPIIQSMLKIAFGMIDSRIYARNCEIRQITNKEAKPFNSANHLQGHRNAQVTYGLFYNESLVQLMSFSYDKKKQWWEIIRGCPGSNNIVVGGVSKLFKHFIREYNPDKIFSYCDFNKFDGKGYEAIGMNFIGYSGPDMSWLMPNGDIVHRRPSKHKELASVAIGKIWGSGSKRYLWTNPNIK